MRTSIAALLLLVVPACIPDDPIPDESFCELRPGCHRGSCEVADDYVSQYQTCGGNDGSDPIVLECRNGTLRSAGWTCPPVYIPVDAGVADARWITDCEPPPEWPPVDAAVDPTWADAAVVIDAATVPDAGLPDAAVSW
jgi:hypothetical protein